MFGFMYFTSWVATAMVFFVMGIPIVFMAYAFFFNRKPLPPEVQTAEARAPATRQGRRR